MGQSPANLCCAVPCPLELVAPSPSTLGFEELPPAPRLGSPS